MGLLARGGLILVGPVRDLRVLRVFGAAATISSKRLRTDPVRSDGNVMGGLVMGTVSKTISATLATAFGAT